MNKQELTRELGHSGAQQLLSGSMARRFYDFGAGRLPGFLANLVNDD